MDASKSGAGGWSRSLLARIGLVQSAQLLPTCVLVRLRRMNVESLWLAHEHVNWETGEPDKGEDYTGPGRSTHCSAFAAAVGKRLGVYMLRPPEHGQILLANAQAAWFRSPAA